MPAPSGVQRAAGWRHTSAVQEQTRPGMRAMIEGDGWCVNRRQGTRARRRVQDSERPASSCFTQGRSTSMPREHPVRPSSDETRVGDSSSRFDSRLARNPRIHAGVRDTPRERRSPSPCRAGASVGSAVARSPRAAHASADRSVEPTTREHSRRRSSDWEQPRRSSSGWEGALPNKAHCAWSRRAGRDHRIGPGAADCAANATRFQWCTATADAPGRPDGRLASARSRLAPNRNVGRRRGVRCTTDDSPASLRPVSVAC